jgi:hypothetical protein
MTDDDRESLEAMARHLNQGRHAEALRHYRQMLAEAVITDGSAPV